MASWRPISVRCDKCSSHTALLECVPQAIRQTKELAKTCDTCGRPSSRAGLFPREIAYTALLPEPCRSDCRAWPWGWGKRERCERSYLFGSCEKPESFTEGGTEGCFSQLKRTTLTMLLRPGSETERPR